MGWQMTERERNRQQWKALRAPVIQRAWDGRKKLRDLYKNIWGRRIPYASYYGRARQLAYQGFPPEDASDGIVEMGHALNLLTAVRAAERAGENALIWKLSR